MSSSKCDIKLPEDVQRLLCHFLDWITIYRWSLCSRLVGELLFSSRNEFSPTMRVSNRRNSGALPVKSLLPRLTNVRKLSLFRMDLTAIPSDTMKRFGDTVTELGLTPREIRAEDFSDQQATDCLPQFNHLRKLDVGPCSPSQIKIFILEHIPVRNSIESVGIYPEFPYSEDKEREQEQIRQALTELAQICASHFAKAKKIALSVDWTSRDTAPKPEYIASIIAPLSKCSELERLSLHGSAIASLLWTVPDDLETSEAEWIPRIKEIQQSLWKGTATLRYSDFPLPFFAIRRTDSPLVWQDTLDMQPLASFVSSPRLLTELIEARPSLECLRVLLAHGLDLAIPYSRTRLDCRPEFLLHYLIELFVEDEQYFELIFFTPLVPTGDGRQLLTPFEYCRHLHPGLLFSNWDTLFAKVLSVETESTKCLEYLLSKGPAIDTLAPDDRNFVGNFNDPDPWGTLPMERCGWIKGKVVAFAVRNGAHALPIVFLRSYFEFDALQACLEKNPNLLLEQRAYNGMDIFTHILTDSTEMIDPSVSAISVILDFALSPAHPQLASVCTSEPALLAVEKFLSFYVNCKMDYPPDRMSPELLADIIRRLILLLHSRGRLKNACVSTTAGFGSSYWLPRWSPPNDPLLLTSDAICEVELEGLRSAGSPKSQLLCLAPSELNGMTEAYIPSQIHKIEVASHSSHFKTVVQEWERAHLTPLHLLVRIGTFYSKTGIVPEVILHVITSIVNAGFPPSGTDANGKTPLQWANQAVMELFVSAGIHF